MPGKAQLQAILAALWLTGARGAILLTGYNPWANFTENPSGELASALNGSLVEQLTVRSLRVDVNEAGVLEAQEAVQKGSWDAIVHLGFEDEAKGLKLETMAANQRALKRGKVVLEGPQLLPTTSDLGAVALNTHNPHELWSRDAGDFFCNEIYYRTLYSIREHRRLRCPGALIPCIFIHVPPLYKMPLQETGLPFRILTNLPQSKTRIINLCHSIPTMVIHIHFLSSNPGKLFVREVAVERRHQSLGLRGPGREVGAGTGSGRAPAVAAHLRLGTGRHQGGSSTAAGEIAIGGTGLS